MKDSLIMLLACVMAFLLGRCTYMPPSNIYTPGPVTSDTVIQFDTVTVQRPAIRLVRAQPSRVRVSQPVATVDTLTGDTVAIEQHFAAVTDTVTSRGDSVRIDSDVTIRAPSGPIELVSLRTSLAVMPLPDTLITERETITINRTLYVERPFAEKLGWAAGGFVTGAVAGAVAMYYIKK